MGGTGPRRLAAKPMWVSQERTELMDDTVDVTRKPVVTVARAALEPTPHGARLRQRFAAFIGIVLLVLGFLSAVGLGKVVAVLLLALLAAACGVVVVRLARRHHDRVSRLARAGRVLERALRAERRTLAGGTLVARQLTDELWRKRLATTRRASTADPRREAALLNARGTDLRRSGDPERAIAAHTDALELVRKLADRNGEAMTLNNLALALGHAGDDQGALDRFGEAAAILRDLRDDHHEGQVVANLGFLHGRRGRREQALSCLETALDKLDPGSHAYRRVEEQLRRVS
jgi:tetratricopeptide (TPR) repeat protein